jgi:hypothetical protein
VDQEVGGSNPPSCTNLGHALLAADPTGQHLVIPYVRGEL